MPTAVCRAAVALLFLSPVVAQASTSERWPTGHARAGLTKEPERLAPYDGDPSHPANRLFRGLWTSSLVPVEVAHVVPGEPMHALAEGWVHGKRAGRAEDRSVFGGDGRMLPLEGLSDAAAAAVMAGLEDLRPRIADLQHDPALAVHLQNDLLRAAERLLDVGQNLDLVAKLRDMGLQLGLPADQLATLPDPLRRACAGATPGMPTSELPTQVGGTAEGFHEITRRSTRLFDAAHTLLWSRVFLRHPDGEAALRTMLPAQGATKGPSPTTPIGFTAVLVQGLVAIDDRGLPRATSLVVDVRTQTLRNRDPLGRDNPTFTRDGLDFRIWHLQRLGLRSGEPLQFFREVHADDLDLFRDYGTAKLTSYRAQCALCHRVSDSPEPELAGFPVLRPHAQAALAATGEERLRLAEQQVGTLLTKLRAAK